mgnify:CR=1 FL=1
MLDFIFSFLLLILSVALILFYVSVVYYIWVSIEYIYNHDETEAQFVDNEGKIF